MKVYYNGSDQLKTCKSLKSSMEMNRTNNSREMKSNSKMKQLLAILMLFFTVTAIGQSSREEIKQKFADAMCSCIEERHKGKPPTAKSMETYFGYCQGYVLVQMIDEVEFLMEESDDAINEFTEALVHKIKTDCPFFFAAIVPDEVKQEMNRQCHAKIVPAIKGEKYADQICSCFTGTYLSLLGSDSLMMKLEQQRQILQIEPSNPLVFKALNRCLNHLGDDESADTGDLVDISCSAIALLYKDDPELRGVDFQKICECAFDKLEKYMLDNIDTEIEDWPAELEQQMLDTCIEEAKKAKRLKKI